MVNFSPLFFGAQYSEHIALYSELRYPKLATYYAELIIFSRMLCR
jgi:hypothetical protein